MISGIMKPGWHLRVSTSIATNLAKGINQGVLASTILEEGPTTSASSMNNINKLYGDSSNDTKYNLCLYGNRMKFSQNKGLRRRLFETGNNLLVYVGKDNLWGIGYDGPDYMVRGNWMGKNLAGKILTKVKNELCLQYKSE